MPKLLAYIFGVMLLLVVDAAGQESDLKEELRAELERLKAQIANIETRLNQLEGKDETGSNKLISNEQTAQIPEQAKHRGERAPALNTPPMLPTSPEGYKKETPRFDVLIQARGDFFADTTRNDTFFLRKAEVGIKGNIAPHVDYSFEIDAARPNDLLRRTYIRLSHLRRLHVKLGLEKAPIGLEELTSTSQIPFVDRSEVSDRFAAAEELGVHLESHWTNWLLQFSVTNGGRRLLRDDNKRKDVTARVVWGPNHWLSVGGAILKGEAGADKRDRERYNAELKLGSNLTGFQSEFYRAKDGSIWSSAYYLAGYWALPAKKEWLTHFQPVIRYEQIDRSDRNAFDELRLLTYGFSLLLKENRSKFQINYLKDLHTGARKDELRAQYQVSF